MLGAFLVSASAARAERSALRSVDAMVRNELRNIGQTWRARGTMTVAIATAVTGVAVLAVACRGIFNLAAPASGALAGAALSGAALPGAALSGAALSGAAPAGRSEV